MAEQLGVPLQDDDRARMARLYEEVRARLAEMALIATRVVGEANPVVARLVAEHGSQLPMPPHHGAEPQRKMEVTCYGSGGGRMCMCYDYDSNTCYVCDGYP